MAPGKKKKKVASNPARGFATVSQPSKAKEALNSPAQDQDGASLSKSSVRAPGERQVAAMSDVNKSPDIAKMSPEELEAHLEDTELQNILEVNAIRCKQDAARQVTKLETERRQLRSQTHSLSTTRWFTGEMIDEILQQNHKQCLLPKRKSQQSLEHSTDILVKLWTLKIVLIALRFSQIDDALEHVVVSAIRGEIKISIDYLWGLQTALEWYSTEVLDRNLPDYENGAIVSQEVSEIAMDDLNIEPSVSASQAYSTSPGRAPIEHSEVVKQEADDQQLEMTPLSATDSEDDDPASLTDRYVHSQTLLFDAEMRVNSAGEASADILKRRARLRARIDRIRRDVLFDADAANAVWEPLHREMKIRTSRSVKSEQEESKLKSLREIQEIDDYTTEEEGEGLLNGIFGLTEEDSSAQADSALQATIRVLDFDKWTGVSPRRLMEESCYSQDHQVSIRFVTLVATSYSVRQKLEIRWSGSRALENHATSALPPEVSCSSIGRVFVLEMRSVATLDATQAESYLSTMCFFLLVQSGHLDHKQSSRLPTVWREIYSDLGQARQRLVDVADKEILRGLRRILHDAENSDEKSGRTLVDTEDSTRTQSNSLGRETRNFVPFSAKEAMEQWASRATSLSYQSMLQIRQQLPVYKYKETILQQIDRSQLLVICADTGAGKSTQVPSFVLEKMLGLGQDCRIIVTQPRRISAITLARRVSIELGEHRNDLGTDRSLVGYAVRLESKTSRSTRLTFATTGVLLRMIEASPQLEDLDCLILDEVHERAMDVDLLFIALKKIQRRRPTLKVILMSATVDAQKFSDYFGGAPVLNVPGRTFPVEIRYLEDAIEDTLDIAAPKSNTTNLDEEGEDYPDTDEKSVMITSNLKGFSDKTLAKLGQMDEYRTDYDLVVSLAEAVATKEKYLQYSSAILIFMPGIAEIRRLHNALLDRKTFASGWVIHLLHSSFSTEDLERAFSSPPAGHRKIVIATNIAETGITIPDVTAVIDTCKEKTMRFDERRQLSRLTEGFISRSSARQRRGRAARVRAGLCFHLVTRHRFESLMLEQHVPEILRLSLQDPILRIKVWNLGSVESTLAAAIDPPSTKNVRRAVDKLKDAGALGSNEELTHLGKIIARLPLEVVLSKLAIFSIVFRCLDAALTIVAILSSKSPFLSNKNGHQTDPRLAFARGDSDLISTLNAYQGWRKARIAGQAHQFCRKHHLSDQSFLSIEDQKTQLLVYLVDAGLLSFDVEEKRQLSRSRLSSGRRTLFDIPERFNVYENDAMLNCVIALAFYPKILTREGKGWRNVYTNQRVNLTSNSVNRATDKPPKWLCFYEAMQTRGGSLNVLETSKIPELIIVAMLGSAEIKYFAGVVILDNGKMRFSLRQWRQVAAIKALRESVTNVLERCWQAPGLWMSASDQLWIGRLANMMAGRNTKS